MNPSEPQTRPAAAQGERKNTDKLRWTLVDFESLKPMVRVLEFGARKYSDHNWKKGLPTTEVAESLLRHLTAYLNGEDLDPESGQPHTGHILCNAMFLSYLHEFMPQCDSRYKDPNTQPVQKVNIDVDVKLRTVQE